MTLTPLAALVLLSAANAQQSDLPLQEQAREPKMETEAFAPHQLVVGLIDAIK